MDDWEAWRIAVVIAAWATVGGGLVLGAVWAAHGGGRAAGPEDAVLAETGAAPPREERRVTAFPSAQVGMHGLLGLLTAGLVTYGAAVDERGGYVALLVALAVTAAPGVAMFRKWRIGWRPHLAGAERRTRPEDAFPKLIVYLHGISALTTATIVVILLALG